MKHTRDSEQIVAIIPCTGSRQRRDSTYEVTQGHLVAWLDTYAGSALGTEAALTAELNMMRKWLTENPSKRRTKQRMPGFVDGWLHRRQAALDRAEREGLGSYV